MEIGKLWPYVSCLVIGVIAGALVASQLSCSNNGPVAGNPASNLLPGATNTKTGPIFIHDTTLIAGRPYAVAVGDHFDSVRVDTLRFPFPMVTPCPETVVSTDPPKPFSLPDILRQTAPTIVAAFEPRNPVQFLEVYLHGGHNFLSGGYSAGGEFDVNLGQIHLAPITLYGDVGYDQGFHLSAGIRGKLWGAI